MWAEKIASYAKNSNYQKVQIMHNFNVDFKLQFVAGNIDLGISSLPVPVGYSSMREFAKDKLAAIYQDMLDFCYPEAIAKIEVLKIECDSNEEWAPIISRARLDIFKGKIYAMLGSL